MIKKSATTHRVGANSITESGPDPPNADTANRQLNYCLHIMAITQISHDTPGRTYYRSKRAAGKSHREALRCLKRRLSDTVYRRLVRDAHTDTEAGPGGHSGATTKSSAAGSTPTTDSSDKSLPEPAEADTTNPTKRST
jgi:transposase